MTLSHILDFLIEFIRIYNVSNGITIVEESFKGTFIFTIIINTYLSVT